MLLGIQSYFYFTMFTIAVTPLRLAQSYHEISGLFFCQLALLVGTIVLSYALAKKPCKWTIIAGGTYMLLCGVASLPSEINIVFSSISGGWIQSVWLMCSIYFIVAGLHLLIKEHKNLP